MEYQNRNLRLRVQELEMQAKNNSVDFNFPSLGGGCPSPITNNGYMKQLSPTHNSSSLLSDISKVS